MIRPGKKVFTSVLVCVVATALTACGGGSHSTLPRPAPVPSTAPAYNGPLTNATFRITIPAPTKASAKARTPAYISAATKSVRINMTASDSAHNVVLGSQFNVLTSVPNGTGSSPGSPCAVDGSHAGNYTCTISVMVPPGSDTFTFTTYDDTAGLGNILSQQIKTLTVVVGKANDPATDPAFNIIFDANATNMTIGATSGFCAGSFIVANGGTVGTVGTTPVTFTAAYKDLAGRPVVTPGLPLLTVNGHTNDNGGGGYTDNTTHLNVKVNQANQTFTLTQTNGTGNAAVSLTSTPPGGDGLSFNNTLSFTFTSGPAPPASFVADAEQIFNTNHAMTGGRISLFTLTLGATDTFSTYTTPQLAVQPPPVGSNFQNSDVDNPNDLLFDSNGDLLIANGGGSVSGSDFGNFACVPAGAITTGANGATVLTTNVDDPAYLALGTDNSVALMNLGVTNNYPRMVQFVLNGMYSPAPASRNVPNTGTYHNLGVTQVVALPTSAPNPPGTFAAVLTNGVATGAGTTINHVVIKRPDSATPGELPQDADVVDPFMAYDAQNNQLVLASDNSYASRLTNFSVATLTKVGTGKAFYDDGTPMHNSQAVPSGPIAASPDGHIAVALGVSGPEVVIYNNNGSGNRAEVSRIVFDAVVTRFGSDYVYGGTGAVNIVMGLRWLVPNPSVPSDPANNKKLLVAFQSSNGATPGFAFTSANGLYIFDISQPTTAPTPCTASGPGTPTASFDPFGNGAVSTKLSGCKQLANGPVAAAYKP